MIKHQHYSKLGTVVMLLLLLLLWASCINPYKYLPNRPPLTAYHTHKVELAKAHALILQKYEAMIL